jgi:hypothetical protein
MSPVVRYSLLRLLVLIVVGALLFASGARDFTLLVLAFVLSGIVSLVLLRRPRGEVAEGLADRIEHRGPRQGLMGRISARIEAANRAEDESLDAAEGHRAGAGDAPGDDGQGTRPAS